MLRQLLRSLARRSPEAVALNEEGIRLWHVGDLKGAEQRFRVALARDDASAAACSNLGMVLVEQRRLAEGLDRLQRAVAIDPAHAGARINLANTLHFDGQLDAALGHYREALRIDPEAPEVLVNVLKPMMDACEWDGVERVVAELSAMHRDAQESRWAGRILPYTALLLPLPPDFQKRIAAHHARQLSAAWSPRRGEITAMRGEADQCRIRVGYLSGELRNNATGHLMAGMFALHDRSRFEIFAYSYGQDDGSEFRRRIEDGCDHFVDIAAEPFESSARRIAGDGIDILVTLSGFAGGNRSEILAMRPAPVQVSYLGYPGTMGADFVDYFLADAVTVPQGSEWHFTERVVRLPHCYQVNDSGQRIAAQVPGRAEAGLPENALVFCCFSQNYKIERSVFCRWMNLLAALPGSVLWLMGASRIAEANLRREAVARGIDPARLVFATHLSKPEHLARHRLADLFLDTRFVNGHTTASDALWAGLPLVTHPGESFCSRVAASLLTAAGLPELIADSAESYERLALALAREPEKLSELRSRITRTRLDMPLFDTRGFVASLERAFATMHEGSRRGDPPYAFDL